MIFYFMSIPALAKFYDNSYPVEDGLESGYFIKFSHSSNDVNYLVMTKDNLDQLVLMSAGGLYNPTNSTIYGVVFHNHIDYQARFRSRQQLEINTNTSGSGSAVWTSYSMVSILDTNYEFTPINKDNPNANNNNSTIII